MFGGMGPQELVLLLLIFLILFITLFPYTRIFAKAGFPWWWSFSQIVPVLNIIVLFYLAFAEWPAHRQLDQKKQNLGDDVPETK